MNTPKPLTAIVTVIKKQKYYLFMFTAIAILAMVLLTGVIIFTHQVYITDNGETKCYLTSNENPDEILSDNNYELSADDEYSFSGFDKNKGEIIITRAYPVSLVNGGQITYINVTGGTVSDALTKAGITLGSDDILTPALDTPVDKDTKITLQRVSYETEVTEQQIPYETVEVTSAAIAKGNTVVSNEGTEGVLNVTTKKMYVDGKLSHTEIINEQVVSEPVDRVVAVGTKSSNTISQLVPPADFQLDANGVPVSYSTVLTGKSAAYSANSTAKTASGRTVKVGYVAVDPKVIPYGTPLYIVSNDSKHVYGYAIAADTGAALVNGSILVDLFFPDYNSSCNWGIHNVSVYVLN